MKITFSLLSALVLSSGILFAADWPEWGGTPDRNMVSEEQNLPVTIIPGVLNSDTEAIDLSKAKNIKWVAKLGSQAYGNTTVSQGRYL